MSPRKKTEKPAFRFEWERVIRVVMLPSTTKLVGMMLASYADGETGDNARPGEDRLAADCCLSDRAVRTHLARLREVGLIERTHRGSANQHRRLADTYALRIPDDLLDKVQIMGDYPGLGLSRDRNDASGTGSAQPVDIHPRYRNGASATSRAATGT